MKPKRAGLLAMAIGLIGFASIYGWMQRTEIASQLGIKPAKPAARKYSPEERAAREKVAAEDRARRDAKELAEVDAEAHELHRDYTARIDAFLKPDQRWKKLPKDTERILLAPGGKPVFWSRFVSQDRRGSDASIGHSLRELLAGRSATILSDAHPLLVDSKKRVWFGSFGTSVPSTQPGNKPAKLSSRDLIVYDRGTFESVRSIVLKKVSDDPTTQGMLASGAAFEHGFEDAEGNLYFVGGLGGWFGIIDRLGTDGTWTRADTTGSRSEILAYPQFTDLKDGRVVLSVAEQREREKPIVIFICDRGTWISPQLKFRDDGKGYLSDVSVTTDGKVIFVDEDQITLHDLDGFSPERLEKRLTELVGQLAIRDPDVRNRAQDALSRFPTQAVPQIKALAERTTTLDTRRRLESAIVDIESIQRSPRPLDGRYLPVDVSLVGRTNAGGVRFMAGDVQDLATAKQLGPSLLTYTPNEGWLARPIDFKGASHDQLEDWLRNVGHGTEDPQGRTWFCDTSYLDENGQIHPGDLRDVFDEAPRIDSAGRLYFTGRYVRDNHIYFRGTYILHPDTTATEAEVMSFRKVIPGTAEHDAARQATTPKPAPATKAAQTHAP